MREGDILCNVMTAKGGDNIEKESCRSQSSRDMAKSGKLISRLLGIREI